MSVPLGVLGMGGGDRVDGAARAYRSALRTLAQALADEAEILRLARAQAPTGTAGAGAWLLAWAQVRGYRETDAIELFKRTGVLPRIAKGTPWRSFPVGTLVAHLAVAESELFRAFRATEGLAPDRLRPQHRGRVLAYALPSGPLSGPLAAAGTAWMALQRALGRRES